MKGEGGGGLIIGSLWYAVSGFGMCEIVPDVVMEIWLPRVGREVELLFLHEPARK